MRTLVVFEDAALHAFSILTPLRAVFDLRCGAHTLLDRLVQSLAPDRVVLLTRPELHALQREQHPDAHVGAPDNDVAAEEECWFVNGRFLALGNDLERFARGKGPGHVCLQGDSMILARCAGTDMTRFAAFLQSSLQTHTSRSLVGAGGLESWLRTELPAFTIEQVEEGHTLTGTESRLIEHAWELVHHNPSALVEDFRGSFPAGIDPSARVHAGAHLLAAESIHIGADCRLGPGVVLDATQGPVMIDAGVEIQPQSVLHGPVYVGPGSVIKTGAKIHEGTTLGPVCKIGGEVEESIVHGYSNKQHEGFLGHAYLGEWVNLGADTNNSDLKNNYSSVRVWESGSMVDTGLLFVGLIAGDHVKSAINTQFNTGTVIGLSSQIFGADFPPKYIPPFSWGGAAGLSAYDFDKALATAETVLERRKKILTPAYEAAFRLAWERSRNDTPPA